MRTLDEVALAHGYNLGQISEFPHQLPIDRVEMLHWFREMSLEMAAEVGVWRGDFSLEMCRLGFQVVAVDPWCNYPGYTRPETEAPEQNYQEAASKLRPYGARLIRHRSPDAADAIPDGTLDLVYIDGCHEFAAVAADLQAWHPKVRDGGIIAGHDFYRSKAPNKCAVKPVVLAWCQCMIIPRLFTTTANHREHTSWFYIKDISND